MIGDCTHPISVNTLLRQTIIPAVSSETTPIETQLESQLATSAVHCHQCHARVHKISLNNFPFPVIAIHSRLNALCFRQISLNNIENGGNNSFDDGDTYRRMALVANDFFNLTHMFGPYLGRILYWLPTSIKAGIYIDHMKKTPGWWWLILSPANETVGILSLSKIDPDKFALDDSLRTKNFYGIGLALRTPYQGKGVLTHIINTIFDQIPKLHLPIDGYWISTLPENLIVNNLAERFAFTYLKTHTVPLVPLPFGFTYSLNLNLYYKLFSDFAS